MSQYVSLLQLKDALGLKGASSDTIDDGALTTVTFQASGLVDEYLRTIRPGYVGFATSSNTHASVGSNTRVYDGTGTDTLWIDDAEIVASVSVDAVAVSSNSWRLWPYNEIPKRAIIYAEPASSTYGLTASTWTTGTANIGVYAYWGLGNVPQDVQAVTLQISVILWRRQQLGDYTGKSTVLNTQRFSGGSGRQFQTIQDPDIAAALSQLDAGWAIGGVWGG